MKGGHRTGTFAWLMINIRSSFWFVPMLMTLAAVALALALVEVEASAGDGLARRWPRMLGADAEGSRAMLSAIASSMITVAGVVFSIISWRWRRRRRSTPRACSATSCGIG